jgi:hypothetical protein
MEFYINYNQLKKFLTNCLLWNRVFRYFQVRGMRPHMAVKGIIKLRDSYYAEEQSKKDKREHALEQIGAGTQGRGVAPYDRQDREGLFLQGGHLDGIQLFKEKGRRGP